MARQPFEVELGLGISELDGNTQVSFTRGAGAPTGTAAQDAYDKGSIYADTTNGVLYHKKTDAGGAGDWVLVSSDTSVARWRPERVDVVTNQNVSVGTLDIVVNPFSDDDGTKLAPADLIVGHYIIKDADGSPSLLEITNVAGDDVTFAAGPSMTEGDAFITKNYLPDPDGGENTAGVAFSDGIMVKLFDIDWQFTDAINLSSSYSGSGANGTPTAGDTAELAFEKLDANQRDLTTLSGVSQGSVDNGTFTGATIPDAQTTKQALQALETAHEEVDANVDDLITLSGVAENATDNGTMDSGTILSDAATTNALLKEVDAELTKQQGKSSLAAVTTITTLDSVLVDDVSACQWNITVSKTSAPAQKKHLVVFAGHNGHAAADATVVDDTEFAKLKLGANFNTTVGVALNLAGASQEMIITITSTEPGGVDVVAKRIETLY